MLAATLATRLVRLLPAERAHMATIAALKAGLGPPIITPSMPISLATRLPRAGLTFSSPVGLAAGFDKNADVFGPMLRFGFGFVECGTVTPKAQPGNPRPRLFRLERDRAVINRMGFNNAGLDPFVQRLQGGGAADLPVGANVGANKTSDDFIADYEVGLRAVWPWVAYITINVSSPNTPGLRGLQGRDALSALLTRCGDVTRIMEEETGLTRAVFLKLAPDLDAEGIADIISVLRSAGDWLAGLIISNTTIARPPALKSIERAETGGLSGAPLMTPSTEILRAFAENVFGEFDLIGAGGIASAEDAYRKIRAGAHSVQLYSAMVYEGPSLAARINRGLDRLLKADGFASINDAVGADL